MSWNEAVKNTPKNSAGGNYMRFEDGSNKFRVMGQPITGWEYWTKDNKPRRSKERVENVPADARLDDGGFRVKFFWAFVVWNYGQNKLQILEITQSTIQQQITDLVKSDEWGDPTGYDLNVNRKGEGLDTVYTVQPSPHKKVDQEIKEKAEVTTINLEALYTGDDPFNSEVVEEEIDSPF